MRRTSPFNIVSVALGLAFLYLPIVILVIYSFNASRLVTVWGGWSLAWYRELLHDDAILAAASISLRVAALSASAATVLGTCAAIALVRMGRFRGRLLFSSMVYAPLVMPEVITGLSLLLLFVAVNIDRGFWTIVFAHTTLTMCFVTVIVQARLIGFDRSLEEAAMDLGCPPLKTFLTITLPLIFPAIAAGWMLAFSLSLDDLVIASFTTGPGATTLPIRIYSQVRLGVKPEINAICTIMVVVVATATIVASLLTKRGAVRRERAAFAAQSSKCELVAAALAGRAQDIDQQPDRHDDHRAQQDIRPRPIEAAPRIVLHAVGRQPHLMHQFVGGNAEMGQDRSHQQRGDDDLGQRPEGCVQHPRPVAPGLPRRGDSAPGR